MSNLETILSDTKSWHITEMLQVYSNEPENDPNIFSIWYI